MSANDNFSNQDGVTLKEYINDKLNNLEKAVDSRFDSITLSVNTALASADKATSKAETASEKRFDAVNEFRATLADQQRNLMPRGEVEILIKAINEKIDNLNLTTISRQGRDLGQKEGWTQIALIAGVISTVVIILSRFIK